MVPSFNDLDILYMGNKNSRTQDHLNIEGDQEGREVSLFFQLKVGNITQGRGLMNFLYIVFKTRMSRPRNRFSDGSPNPQQRNSVLEQLDSLSQSFQDSQTSRWLSFFQICPQSIPALSEIKHVVQSCSLTQSLKIITIDKKAVSHIKELNALEIKETLIGIIDQDILQISESLHLEKNIKRKSQKIREPRSLKSEEEIEEIGKDYLKEVVLKLSTSLQKNQNLKPIYKYIGFQWAQNITSVFFDIVKFKQEDIENVNTAPAEENNEQIPDKDRSTVPESSQIQSSELVPQSVLSLLNKVKEKSISLQLFSQFFSLYQNLSLKELQLKFSKSQNQELSELLNEQIAMIDSINNENRYLEQRLMLNSSQYQNIRQRCENLEEELSQTVQMVDALKKESQNQEKKQSYYINPLFEKAKIEEKYMSELIQFESDLCLERSRTNSMVDLILDQIKMTHKAFYDLGSSSYFIHKFDKTLYRKFKMLKAFDGVNLDQILLLKEESLQEENDNLYKSTISTFSSISMDKLHISHEEDSFEENE